MTRNNNNAKVNTHTPGPKHTTDVVKVLDHLASTGFHKVDIDTAVAADDYACANSDRVIPR